jgi:hypothetical protein
LKDEGISAIGIDEASIEKHDDLEDEGVSAIGIDEASIDKHEELEDEGRSVKYFFGTTIEKARISFPRSNLKKPDLIPFITCPRPLRRRCNARPKTTGHLYQVL